ncbi:MAG: hypothetical protein ACYTFY_05195 [Planctomycetota bacterium]|jgi:L-fucose isomerase-like protein
MAAEKPVVAFVGFGEVNTPREFIVDRCKEAVKDLTAQGLEIIEAPVVSDDPAEAESKAAVDALKGREFAAMVVCIAGWIPSWAVFKVLENFKHIPMVLWGLSGWQEGDRFVTTADQAGSTALRKPMADMGYTFKYIVNYRGKESRVAEVASYCKAANVAAMLKGAKIGMGGYRDMRLYGTLYDGVSLKGKIGVEIEHFELMEFQKLMENVTESDVSEMTAFIKDNWDFVKDPQEGTIEQSVKLYCAVKEKIEDRGYAAFSYNDVDGIKKIFEFAPAGAMTLLHEKKDIPTVPENDCMGSVTQLMVNYLTGQIAAYLEFYEFMEDGALMGVPDYVPREIVDGKVTIMPNSFGDFGEGLLNVSKLKTGKVTLARLGYKGDKYVMHMLRADAKAPIKWEEAGWAPPAPQLPSLDVIMGEQTEDFISKVMGQHYIISYGDNIGLLSDLCSILDVEII